MSHVGKLLVACVMGLALWSAGTPGMPVDPRATARRLAGPVLDGLQLSAEVEPRTGWFWCTIRNVSGVDLPYLDFHIGSSGGVGLSARLVGDVSWRPLRRERGSRDYRGMGPVARNERVSRSGELLWGAYVDWARPAPHQVVSAVATRSNDGIVKGHSSTRNAPEFGVHLGHFGFDEDLLAAGEFEVRVEHAYPALRQRGRAIWMRRLLTTDPLLVRLTDLLPETTDSMRGGGRR